MFKSESQKWLEMQPKHTQIWLKKQPIWHDRDLYTFGALTFGLGVMVGMLCAISIF